MRQEIEQKIFLLKVFKYSGHLLQHNEIVPVMIAMNDPNWNDVSINTRHF